MIRVLHELNVLDGDGIAKLLYSYYKYMDHNKIQFDFLIYDYSEEGILEKPLKEMGCNIYKVVPYSIDRKQYFHDIKKIIRNGHHDVFHSHIGPQSVFTLYFAKKYGVLKRFVHSHIAYEDLSLKTRISVEIQAVMRKHLATQLFACGRDAGIYRWGKHATESGKVKIMPNAIETEQFRFNLEKRERIRKELGIENKLVLGIVARVCHQKNHPYLFRVFVEVLKKTPRCSASRDWTWSTGY